MSASDNQSVSLFGWDLIVKSVETELQSEEDVLFLFVHLVLINSGFRTIDLGESTTFDGNEPKTEALPPGWAAAKAVRYNHQGKLYVLKCTPTGGAPTDDDAPPATEPRKFLINLLRVDEQRSTVVELNGASVASVRPPLVPLAQMLPQHHELAATIKTNLIDELIVSTRNRDASSQTQRESATSTPQFLPYHHPHVHPDLVDVRPSYSVPSFPAAPVGRDDLNPFHNNPMYPGGGMGPAGVGGGGGMLYEPPRIPRYPLGGPSGSMPGGIPRGSLPPGARFDPFRPPDVDPTPPRRFPPDSDEFPPPDMFM